LSTESDFFSGDHSLGQGAMVSALVARCHTVANNLRYLSQDADITSNQCLSQSDHDAELAKAPSVEDVSVARAGVLAMTAAMQAGQVPANMVTSSQDALRDMVAVREAAVAEHANRTSGTSFPTTRNGFNPDSTPFTKKTLPGEGDGAGATDIGATSQPLPDFGGTAAGADFATGGDTFGAGTDGDALGGGMASDDTLATMVSSDPLGGGLPMGGQPPLMQPMAAQQVQPPPGGMPMGAPMGGGMPGMPVMPPLSFPTPSGTPSPSGPSRLDTDLDSSEDAYEPNFENPDWTLDTSVSSGGGWVPEQGSSVSGVTTRADVSGVTAPVVGATGGSASATRPTTGMMGAPFMPMGAMGGMGAAAGTAGGKERPVILSQDRELLARESLEQSIDSGLVGRDTSEVPRT
jgi:hypothetical protein